MDLNQRLKGKKTGNGVREKTDTNQTPRGTRPLGRNSTRDLG